MTPAGQWVESLTLNHAIPTRVGGYSIENSRAIGYSACLKMLLSKQRNSSAHIFLMAFMLALFSSCDQKPPAKGATDASTNILSGQPGQTQSAPFTNSASGQIP